MRKLILMERRHHPVLYAGVFTIAMVLVDSSPFAMEWACPKLEPLPLSAMLLPPPCDECEETKAELAELMDLQKMRNPDRATHALGDQKKGIRHFLGEIGLAIRDQTPLSDRLFKCIAQIADEDIADAKATFYRRRPYKLAHNQLQVLKDLKLDDSSSYPSGHAAYGTIVGLVLVEMIPEKRELIMKRIRDYGFSRMVAGVHFRSDVYAGQAAGSAIAASLFRNTDFLAGFEKSKPELRKALGY